MKMRRSENAYMRENDIITHSCIIAYTHLHINNKNKRRENEGFWEYDETD